MKTLKLGAASIESTLDAIQARGLNRSVVRCVRVLQRRLLSKCSALLVSAYCQLSVNLGIRLANKMPLHVVAHGGEACLMKRHDSDLDELVVTSVLIGAEAK